MKIIVYGSGCKGCHKMYDAVVEAVNEIGTDIQTEYISDMKVIMAKGFMSMPVLEIDGRVVAKGRVLKKKDIVALINA